MTKADTAALALRLVLGVVVVAHGWNHWRGGGRVEGTARWFASLGLAPPRLHAWSSVLVELAAGAALVGDLLTPVACAAVIGAMTVAGVCAHRPQRLFRLQRRIRVRLGRSGGGLGAGAPRTGNGVRRPGPRLGDPARRDGLGPDRGGRRLSDAPDVLASRTGSEPVTSRTTAAAAAAPYLAHLAGR